MCLAPLPRCMQPRRLSDCPAAAGELISSINIENEICAHEQVLSLSIAWHSQHACQLLLGAGMLYSASCLSCVATCEPSSTAALLEARHSATLGRCSGWPHLASLVRCTQSVVACGKLAAYTLANAQAEAVAT